MVGDVENATIRANGKLYNTSICGSGLEDNRGTGRLKDRRRDGVADAEEAIADQKKAVDPVDTMILGDMKRSRCFVRVGGRREYLRDLKRAIEGSQQADISYVAM